ncbi:MAG: hypothetical protein HUJ72_01850 [Blautia sp.]|nr:hypothetical protein [Blautia sp.]
MHSFKKTGKPVLVLAVVLVILYALDFALYPCTFTRNDVHAVTTNTYDDIYMGSSHGKMGIDPAVMESVSGRTGYNLCVGAEYCIDAYYLTKLILEKGHKPKRIVYDVAQGYFTSRKEEGNNYLLFYHEFPLSKAKIQYFWDAIRNCNFRTLLMPWYEYPLTYELEHMGETFSKKWHRDYGIEDLKSDTQIYHESGFVERYPVDTQELIDQGVNGINTFSVETVDPENMEYLRKLIALCKEEEIEFIAVITPIPEISLAAYSESYSQAYMYFDQFFAENDVRCINFNSNQLFSLFTHDLADYTDYNGHMNGETAIQFSELLAKILDGELPEAAPVKEAAG